MTQDFTDKTESSGRLEQAYRSEKSRFISRLRATGRSLEEAEDFVQELYAETLGRLSALPRILNIPAWLNALFSRRLIDIWRHERVRKKCGETDVAEGVLQEIISAAGLDPHETYVRNCLMDALNDALHALPPAQRKVIEAQVFGGLTFREISETSGIGIDTLTARKRYALRNLSHALRHWINPR